MAASEDPRGGRSAETLRPLFLKVGVNPSAAGSSYVEMGATKVMAAVYGPREAPRGPSDVSTAGGALECDVRYAPFATRPRRERNGASVEAERQASQALESALRPALLLERYPKSTIEVCATVLESDGGDASACLVAAALAAADAGIDMVDLPASVSVVGRRASSSSMGGAPAAAGAAAAAAAAAAGAGSSSGDAALTVAVDPTAGEVGSAAFALTVTLLPRVGLLTHTAHSGEAPADAFVAALRLAMDGCVSVFDAMRAALGDAARRKARAAAATATAAAAVPPAAAVAGAS